MSHRRHLLATSLPLIALLAACDDEAGGSDCVGAACEPDTDGGRPLPDALDDLGADVGDTGFEEPDVADAGADPTDEPDVIQVGCEPGLRACVDEDNFHVCREDGSGFDEPVTCEPDQTCRFGTCLDNGPCTPGPLGCYDDTSLLVCAEDGFDTTVEACPGDWICMRDRCVDPACNPAEKSYIGCDFWASDLDNEAGAATLPAVVTVSNTRDHEIGVTLINGVTGARFEDTLDAGRLRTYTLQNVQVDDTSISNRTYRIETTAPVTVHQFNPRNNQFEVYSNDASLLLPSGALGQEYMVLGWPTEDLPDTNIYLNGFVAVVGTQDDTQVTVRTPVAIAEGEDVAAIEAGGEAQITLNRGQILTLTTNDEHGADLSGLEVSANAPVAVWAGAECANVPHGVRYCDHLESQVMPLGSWGTEYVAAKFQPRGEEPDLWRIIAAEDGTTLTTVPPIDGVDGAELDRGEVLEFVTRIDFVVTGSAPISVGQYMVGSQYLADGAEECARPSGEGCAIPTEPICELTAIGDPAFLLTVPTNQLRDNYLLLTPSDYEEDYLSVVFRDGTTIDMDDEPLDTGAADAIEGSDWRVLRIPVANGVHHLTGTDTFALYAYGYDCDVSYAYPGGMNLETVE